MATKIPKERKQTTLTELIESRFHRTAYKIALLTPEELALLREQQEKEATELRAEYQPGKSYFSYILEDDCQYRVLEQLPPIELMDKLKAMRLTACMIAGISHNGHLGRAMIIVGMHHNSRVVEYTFDLVVDKVGNTKLYEPLM